MADLHYIKDPCYNYITVSFTESVRESKVTVRCSLLHWLVPYKFDSALLGLVQTSDITA